MYLTPSLIRSGFISQIETKTLSLAVSLMLESNYPRQRMYRNTLYEYEALSNASVNGDGQ